MDLDRKLKKKMLSAVRTVSSREKRKKKKVQEKRTRGIRKTFRRGKTSQPWRVNKKSDIPVYVEKYLREVKNPATSGEMYNYGLERKIFGVYIPKSKKAMASQIVGRCKNRVCRYLPESQEWELIEEEECL